MSLAHGRLGHFRWLRNGMIHYTLAMSGKSGRWQDRVIPEPNSGCWLWDGRYSNAGYGTYGGGRARERVQAHRLAWEEMNGPIPDGLFVLHKCDVRGCVNVDHLFLGTAKDNTRDMMAKGRARFVGGLHNSRKTHCKHGHPFIEDRIYVTKRGARVCLECARLGQRGIRALIRQDAEKGLVRNLGSFSTGKMECKRGHPFDAKNTRISGGSRRCRECDKLYARTRRALGRAVS